MVLPRPRLLFVTVSLLLGILGFDAHAQLDLNVTPDTILFKNGVIWRVHITGIVNGITGTQVGMVRLPPDGSGLYNADIEKIDMIAGPALVRFPNLQMFSRRGLGGSLFIGNNLAGVVPITSSGISTSYPSYKKQVERLSDPNMAYRKQTRLLEPEYTPLGRQSRFYKVDTADFTVMRLGVVIPLGATQSSALDYGSSNNSGLTDLGAKASVDFFNWINGNWYLNFGTAVFSVEGKSSTSFSTLTLNKYYNTTRQSLTGWQFSMGPAYKIVLSKYFNFYPYCKLTYSQHTHKGDFFDRNFNYNSPGSLVYSNSHNLGGNVGALMSINIGGLKSNALTLSADHYFSQSRYAFNLNGNEYVSNKPIQLFTLSIGYLVTY